MKNQIFTLIQFFLIIFIYHTLKDLKDTLVITEGGAGAEIIPFLKIWVMLPCTILISYIFSKLLNYFGRDKLLYFFIIFLLTIYLIFAFILYPMREHLFLSGISQYLKNFLPSGCRGFIAMVCFWPYTVFYVTAELWSLLILTILFWGILNDTLSLKEAKKFYPICILVGNFAGIASGQFSYFLCHHLQNVLNWQMVVQCLTLIITFCALIIMVIHYRLSLFRTIHKPKNQPSSAASFKENIGSIFRSFPLFCIAMLVFGFALTSNLIEVIWKDKIRELHPSPQSYNSYINQLTSLIGIFSVIAALVSRWFFQIFSWTRIALFTPVGLVITSSLFFLSLFLKETLQLIVALGSIHYVFGLTAKYTVFDTTKEMAFFSIPVEERMKAKSIIDSIGSRLGKSGASCLYQFFLITLGSVQAHISLVALLSIFVITVSIFTTKKLGRYLT